MADAYNSQTKTSFKSCRLLFKKLNGVVVDLGYTIKDEAVELTITNDEKMTQYTIKIYYPKLYLKNIISLSQLVEERPKLLDENDRFLSKSVYETFASIDLFYDIYKYKKSNLNYKNKMKEFDFVPQTSLVENKSIQSVLSNSFGFGGNTSALLFSKN